MQGWWLRVEQEVGGLLAARRGDALPGNAVRRLDRLEAAVGRLQTVLEAAARQLEASAANSQARCHATQHVDVLGVTCCLSPVIST